MAFWESWKIGCYCPVFFLVFLSPLLVIAGVEVGENYTQRPNRSLLSKASRMHLSELNTYTIMYGGGERRLHRNEEQTEERSDAQVYGCEEKRGYVSAPR